MHFYSIIKMENIEQQRTTTICSECKLTFDNTDMDDSCYKCNVKLCEECRLYCLGCKLILCDSHNHLCDSCSDTVCSACVRQCYNCSEQFCNDCCRKRNRQLNTTCVECYNEIRERNSN